MQEEYIVWGIPPGSTDEQVLFTKAQSLAEAQKVAAILSENHCCTGCRVQVIEFNYFTGIEFIQTIN